MRYTPHDEAMRFLDEHDAAVKGGRMAEARRALVLAVHLESRAMMQTLPAKQPTRSVLGRSAISMALQAGLCLQASFLAREAIRNAPPEIADEINELIRSPPPISPAMEQKSGKRYKERELAQIRSLHELGLPLAYIAAATGRTIDGLAKVRRDAGLPPRPLGGARPGVGFVHTQETLAEVVRLRSQGCVQRQIAARMRIPLNAVRQAYKITRASPPEGSSRASAQL